MRPERGCDLPIRGLSAGLCSRWLGCYWPHVAVAYDWFPCVTIHPSPPVSSAVIQPIWLPHRHAQVMILCTAWGNAMSIAGNILDYLPGLLPEVAPGPLAHDGGGGEMVDRRMDSDHLSASSLCKGRFEYSLSEC